MKNGRMTKTERKLISFIGEKLFFAANSNFDTEGEIEELEKLGFAAVRLADWLAEEQIDEEMDEVKCAMVCEALGEVVSNFKLL